MFDIRLSDEQRQFQQLARDFAQKELKPKAMPLDREPEWEKRIPWDLLKKGSELGFRTFVLAEENGGSGMSDQPARSAPPTTSCSRRGARATGSRSA